MFSYILLSKLNVFLILFFCSCTITPIVCWLWEINGFWIRRLRKGLCCPPLTGFVLSSSDIPEKSLFAQFLHLWFWSLFAQFLHLWSSPPLDPGVEVYNCTTVFQEESTAPRSLQDSAQFWRNFCDSHPVSKFATRRAEDCCVCQRTFISQNLNIYQCVTSTLA